MSATKASDSRLSSAMWLIGGLLLVTVGLVVRASAPLFAMVSSQMVESPVQETEDVLARALIRDFGVVEDPSTWTRDIASKSTHTLWLVFTEPVSEAEAAERVQALRARRCGFVDVSGHMPELRVGTGVSSEHLESGVIPIGSIELPPGTWRLEAPETPPGSHYAVSYSQLTLEDVALMYPTATRRYRYLGIAAVSLGVLLIVTGLWRWYSKR